MEKCTFCDERLAQGKLPLASWPAPVHAMTFGDLKDEKSPVVKLLRENYSICRKPELGTQPGVYYLV